MAKKKQGGSLEWDEETDVYIGNSHLQCDLKSTSEEEKITRKTDRGESEYRRKSVTTAVFNQCFPASKKDPTTGEFKTVDKSNRLSVGTLSIQYEEDLGAVDWEDSSLDPDTRMGIVSIERDAVAEEIKTATGNGKKSLESRLRRLDEIEKEIKDLEATEVKRKLF